MKFWGITEVKLYLKDHKMEKINFDIFNNEENRKNENKNNAFSDTSEQTSDNEEKQLKEFKMNLNINSEMAENLTERKKNELSNNFDNNTNRRKSIIKLRRVSDPRKNQKSQNKKRKSIDYGNIGGENDDLGYPNTINAKSRNNQNLNVKINKTVKNEEYLLDKNNDEGNKSKSKNNQFIQGLMSSFNSDSKEQLFLSPNKRISTNEYPLILTNRNEKNNNNEKHAQQNYKKYKDSGKYGKKLNYVLKQKTTKKD